MKTQTPTKRTAHRLAAALAIATALATGGAYAADLYWKGGTGTESNPADIYDAANWTASSSYSGDSIASSPTSSDILNFKFSALTYLTNSMENADSAAVCNQANFHDGDCVILGDVKSAGTVRIGQNSGETSNIELKGALSVGGVISLGQAGYGTLTVEDGGSLAVSSTSASYVAQNANSKGDLVINGGNASFNGILYVGNSSTGTLTINRGNTTVTGDLYVGYNGTGTLTMKGGTFEVASGKTTYVGYNSGKTGTVNLNGGTLKTQCVKANKGKGYLNFDGGTLQANANNTKDFIGNLAAVVNVQSGGGTIDVNGHNVKIAKTIDGAGAMTFKGGGTITFSYNCNHEGGTTIELGTKVSMTAVSTTTILDNLVIDGRAVLEAKTYDVFLKSGLTEAATNNITLVNCAAGSTVGFDNDETPTKIAVTLAEPTCVNTTTSIMAFPGKTLDEIKYADFTSRMLGQYANAYNALGSAKGCNKKFYYDGGNLSSIVVEFQASDGANIRCVVVEFTDGEGGVYAKALGARYQSNASLGFVFLEQDKTTWNGVTKVVATSRAEADYGVCDFRYTMGGTPDAEWMLDADKTWSALRNGATLADGDIVRITVVNADAVLTVDEDVNVGRIEFVSGSGTTLRIADGETLTAEDVSGIGFVHNDGTFVKTGAGMITLPFDRDYAATGVTIVSNGTLMVSKTGTGNNCHSVRVASGATFDINGNSVSFAVTLEDGAHFVNNGTDIPNTYQQANSITLEGNATVLANNGHFGFHAPGSDTTYLNLGSHTLTINGSSAKEFMLCNTTINGDGTIYVASGRFCTRSKDSTGEDCTISIGASGFFENNKHLTVKNFVNNGTISFQNKSDGWGRGELEITGRFESKATSFPKLTLTGATVKAPADGKVTVLDTFKASGTITIDASEITKTQLEAAEDERIPVLTVPTTDAGGSWAVANPPTASIRAKWGDNGDGTSTLYLAKSTGLMVIIR